MVSCYEIKERIGVDRLRNKHFNRVYALLQSCGRIKTATRKKMRIYPWADKVYYGFAKKVGLSCKRMLQGHDILLPFTKAMPRVYVY